VDKLPDHLRQSLVELLLSVADDKLMLGHRNADWTGLAPMLEEDIAFSSLAQDELAHALTLYQWLAGLTGGNADRLAYGRQPADYRCAQLLELSDEFNWAVAMGRNFFCDHYDFLRLNRLAQSSYTPLAQLAARLAAEEQVHVEHVESWVRRLGRGGDEAQARMQQALDQLAPLAAMLWEPTPGLAALEDAGTYPRTTQGDFASWSGQLQQICQTAGLRLQLAAPAPAARGGRRGVHSAEFPALLEELTEVYRLEPEAAW
jgi:ring-1,2-phenylacetyl-CoA epoxidase subunit PaaC